MFVLLNDIYVIRQPHVKVGPRIGRCGSFSIAIVKNIYVKVSHSVLKIFQRPMAAGKSFIGKAFYNYRTLWVKESSVKFFLGNIAHYFNGFVQFHHVELEKSPGKLLRNPSRCEPEPG